MKREVEIRFVFAAPLLAIMIYFLQELDQHQIWGYAIGAAAAFAGLLIVLFAPMRKKRVGVAA